MRYILSAVAAFNFVLQMQATVLAVLYCVLRPLGDRMGQQLRGIPEDEQRSTLSLPLVTVVSSLILTIGLNFLYQGGDWSVAGVIVLWLDLPVTVALGYLTLVPVSRRMRRIDTWQRRGYGLTVRNWRELTIEDLDKVKADARSLTEVSGRLLDRTKKMTLRTWLQRRRRLAWLAGFSLVVSVAVDALAIARSLSVHQAAASTIWWTLGWLNVAATLLPVSLLVGQRAEKRHQLRIYGNISLDAQRALDRVTWELRRRQPPAQRSFYVAAIRTASPLLRRLRSWRR